MSRNKGLLNISANFEPQIAEPFDARSRVETLTDLTNASIWLANDGGTYVYDGMPVVVFNDANSDNNGIYYLKDSTDVTDINNWEKIGDSTSSANISGGYVTSVNNISGDVFLVGTDGIEIDSSGNTITISVSGDFATNTDLDDYTLLSTTESISSNLQSQINDIEQESTVIESSGGSILVNQNGSTWNLEVSSAPIQDHNDLNGLQGGDTGEYYHLTQSQFNDYIGSTEVENISSGLDSRLNTIESDYVTSTDIQNFITSTEVESISSNLQTQINNIEEEQTTLIGTDGIEVVESPTHTWTVSVSGDFAESLEIVNVNSPLSVTDFNKVYSMQGTGSYTVTLPVADSSNLNEIFYFYKEGNSNLDEFITLQTSASQEIRANRTTYTSLQFRFAGEAIVLISHGSHWDVLSEANLFNTSIKIDDETSFINAIRKLNVFDGGSIIISSSFTITANRTIDLTGIRIFADSGDGTAIAFSSDSVRLIITGEGFYFDSIRFKGVRTARQTGTSQYFLELLTSGVNSGKFENCTFRDLVTRNQNTTNGNIKFTRIGSGAGWNITFTDCDIFTAGDSGNADGLHFVNGSSSHSFMNLFCFGHKRNDSNFNLFRITGTSILANNGNGWTDGSVIFDETPVDDRITNKYITTQKPLISYQIEKTTIDSVDDLLIHDKTSDELRRISFSNLTQNLVTTSDISGFITTTEVENISSNLQSQIDSIQGEQTILIGTDGIEVLESPTHTWTVSVSGDFATNTDLNNLDSSLTSLIVDVSGNLQTQISAITVPTSADFDGVFVKVSGDTMTGNLSVPTVDITGYASFTSKVSGEVPWEEGRVFYCDDDKTLCYFNDNDNVKVNIGQETIIRVTNRTGTAIEDGKVVYISGAFAGGNRVTINLADATLGFAKVIGVTTCDIPDSQYGYVTTEGLVKNINTSSFTVGDELYLDPNNPGELTNVMPISPNKKIRIGFVTKVGTTDGIIFVKVFNGNELSQLHDVTTTSPISGDLITWDGEKWTNEYNINTLGITSGLQGRLPLNDTDKIYTITHPEIDPNEEYPVVSLDIPTSGSDLFVQGVYDRQAESFKVELSGIPNSSYGILWHISTQETSNGGSDNSLSYFDPFVIDSTPELVNISGSEYYTEIQQSYGNLIAIDANVVTYAEIEVRISSEWTTSQVGTFRLDLDVKSGQTFTFDNSIDGINDVTLPDISGAASLLFDKPYGTSTWYVRQNI